MPLYDDNSKRVRVPFVNYILIGINIFVFVMFQNFGENERFIYTFSAVPAEIISGKDIQSGPTVLGKKTLRRRDYPTWFRANPLHSLHHANHLHVHACRRRPYFRQHAFPLDLW